MIELSVAMPLFRAKYIGWLAFEGLCRQEDIDFELELVVAEEIDDEALLGESLGSYENRLKKVGCSRLVYIPLEEFIPLARKIRILAKNCSSSSKIFATSAADILSPPKRLKTQYDVFISDPEVDWCTNARTIVYDIESERCYLQDLTGKNVKKKNDGANRAIRMEIARNLPLSSRKSSIDGWVWECSNNYVKKLKKKFKTYLDMTDNWKYGLNVNGLNNLSLGRSARFDKAFIKKSDRLRECPIDINNTIPKDIMDRLRECKQYIELHKRGIPGGKK
jgi:hypothetical protein